MLSPLIFAIVVDVVTEHAREGLLNEILYADDLVLTSESLEDLRERFQRWRSAVEDKGLKVNVGKTRDVPDTRYPANLTYRISGSSLSGRIPHSSTKPKLIFGCFLSTAPRCRFARLANHETIA